MPSELKPCPFPHLEGRGVNPLRVVGPQLRVVGPQPNYYWSARVECSCGAAGPWMNTAEEAVTAWNTRPSDWTPITPENLPKVGDEVGRWTTAGVFARREAHANPGDHTTFEFWSANGWTHFRPINAPEPSGVQGKENAS